MREVFQQELREVQERLVEIAELVAISIDKATRAFNESDVSLAEEVIAEDPRIDQATVALDELAITEELHDSRLNPIQARARVSLQVLSYNDLSLTNPGYYMFLAHQVIKETFAGIGSIRSLGDLKHVVKF